MVAHPLISRQRSVHRLPTLGRFLPMLLASLRRRWQAMLDAEHLTGQPAYLLNDIGFGADDIEQVRRGGVPRTLQRTTPVDRTGRGA